MAHRSRVFTHCSPAPSFFAYLCIYDVENILRTAAQAESMITSTLLWLELGKIFKNVLSAFIISRGSGKWTALRTRPRLFPVPLLCTPLQTRAGAGQTKLSLRTSHRRQLSNKTLINCFLAGVLWVLPTPFPGNSTRVESFFALIKGLMVSCKYLLSAFGAATDSSPQPADQNPMANRQQQQQQRLWGRKRGHNNGAAMWRHWTLLCFIGQVRYKVQIVGIVFDLCRRTREIKWEMKYIQNYYRWVY